MWASLHILDAAGRLPQRPLLEGGENLAWGTEELGSVRAIFSAWIHSPDHLENILGPFSQIGIGVKVGNLSGYSGVHLWTQEFGSHCGLPTTSRASRRARLAGARVVR